MNLAVADMTVGIFFAPAYIFENTFTHPDGATGYVLCKLLTRGTWGWVGAGASVVSLVTIAVERYYAVVHPLENKGKLTKRKIKVCEIFFKGRARMLGVFLQRCFRANVIHEV